MVEIFLAKGEIAHYEQFLLLTQCFQKSSAAEASGSICMWKAFTHTGSDLDINLSNKLHNSGMAMSANNFLRLDIFRPSGIESRVT